MLDTRSQPPERKETFISPQRNHNGQIAMTHLVFELTKYFRKPVCCNAGASAGVHADNGRCHQPLYNDNNYNNYNHNNHNNCGIQIALHPNEGSKRFTTLCGGLCQTAYLGPNCSHAVHNFIREDSMIHRCPQIRISDKPSHRGHRPLLFPSTVWVL